MSRTSGCVPNSSVLSSVRPMTLDPIAVDFVRGAGILAFAVTAHPDFDDTPWYAENGDGNPDDDGAVRHAHGSYRGTTTPAARARRRSSTLRRARSRSCRRRGPACRS